MKSASRKRPGEHNDPCHYCAARSEKNQLESQFQLKYQGGAEPFYQKVCPMHLARAVRIATEGHHDSVIVKPL